MKHVKHSIGTVAWAAAAWLCAETSNAAGAPTLTVEPLNPAPGESVQIHVAGQTRQPGVLAYNLEGSRDGIRLDDPVYFDRFTTDADGQYEMNYLVSEHFTPGTMLFVQATLKYKHREPKYTNIVVVTVRDDGKMPALVPPYEGPFDPRRIPVELQAWWSPQFGHIHAAALVPLGQVVSGTLEMNVRTVLHDNPSIPDDLRLRNEDDLIAEFHFEDKDKDGKYDGMEQACDETGTVCAFSIPLVVDTTKMHEGENEMRLRMETDTVDDPATPEDESGKQYFNSSGIPVRVDNTSDDGHDYDRWCPEGSPDGETSTSLIGRGWYDGFGYTVAIIKCVPLQPITGEHTFEFRAQQDSLLLQATLDRSHFIPAVGPWPETPATTGKLLFEERNVDGDIWYEVTVNTPECPLGRGWHSFAVRAEGMEGDQYGNFPSGVAKVWFFVE